MMHLPSFRPALAAFILCSGAALAMPSHADSQLLVEVALEDALSPVTGFDDNDTIEVVLHGKLPNSCYHLERAISERQADGAIRIRQFATVTDEGLCYDKSTLPPHLKMAPPFTTVLQIGRLPVGPQRFVFSLSKGLEGDRVISVEKAPGPGVDNLPYAPITSIQSRDYLNGAQDLVVTLNGILTSDCVEVDPSVRVLAQGDVYVLLPVIRTIPGACPTSTSEPRPFSLQVNLGRPANGHYLIYTRSMAGNALSKVVEVLR